MDHVSRFSFWSKWNHANGRTLTLLFTHTLTHSRSLSLCYSPSTQSLPVALSFSSRDFQLCRICLSFWRQEKIFIIILTTGDLWLNRRYYSKRKNTVKLSDYYNHNQNQVSIQSSIITVNQNSTLLPFTQLSLPTVDHTLHNFYGLQVPISYQIWWKMTPQFCVWCMCMMYERTLTRRSSQL